MLEVLRADPLGGAPTPIGAYEIYADAGKVARSTRLASKMIWAAIAGVSSALWLGLVLLVRGASRRSAARPASRGALRGAARVLRSARGELARGDESLNATVEAKDPYTAGHSKRVQRRPWCSGRSWTCDDSELDALGFGALFHDIGKIAIPDAILIKPAGSPTRSTSSMKAHSLEGARIAAKFGRIREAVPIIRHHHERWDGRGYPDGLAEEGIPLAAAIVGLADAWDAMTTAGPTTAR